MKRVLAGVIAAFLGVNICLPVYAHAAETEDISEELTESLVDTDEENVTEVISEEDILDEEVPEEDQDSVISEEVSVSETEDIITDEMSVASELLEAETDSTESFTEESGYLVTFTQFEGGYYIAYDRQQIEEAVSIEYAESAYARNSETGEIDTTGNGQVNFAVVLEEGYSVDSIEVTEGQENYKNLKSISNEENVYNYRLTKVTGNITVLVQTNKSEGDEEETQPLYQAGEVPQVYISTSDGNGNDLTKEMGKVDANVVIVDTDGSLLEGDGTIKVRGNTTAIGPKKPYNIKFSSKQNVLGMGKAKKWCLLANLFDPTLLRNSTALEIAREMGVPYTSEWRIVEVWLDGKFKGCYLLTEAVEIGENRVDIDSDNGEFILEYEKQRYEEDATYITNANGLRFVIKDPEEPSAEQYAVVKDVLTRITNIVDAGNYEAVKEVLDVDSFAKFFVLNEYMNTYDFNFSSVNFFYKNGKMYAGPAWDYDLSSGNYYINNSYTHEFVSESNVYPYLFKYSEFKNLIAETFNQYSDYLAGITAEGGYIDRTYKANKNVFARNFNEAGWNVARKYIVYQGTPFATYEDNYTYYLNWLNNRYRWMVSYIRKLQVNEEKQDIIIIKDTEDIFSSKTGEKCEFKIGATGNNLSYMWYCKGPSDDRFHKTGNSTNVYTRSASKANDGMQVYCVVSDSYGNKIDGRTAMLKFDSISYPNGKNIKLSAGKTVTFKVEYSLADEKTTYKWYFAVPESAGGDGKFRKSQSTTNECSKAAAKKNDGMQAYCVITTSDGRKIESEVMTFSLKK